jgi:hypothetical protein
LRVKKIKMSNKLPLTKQNKDKVKGTNDRRYREESREIMDTDKRGLLIREYRKMDPSLWQ